MVIALTAIDGCCHREHIDDRRSTGGDAVAELGRRALAEALGTAFLLAAVVGSGIMATELTADVGLQLLINSVATAAALVALILALGSVSGAHLNPLVTLADRFFGGIDTRTAVIYVIAQVVGAVVGAVVANAMFGLAAIEVSSKVRTGGGIWLGEVVATLGLLLVIFGVVRSGRLATVPFAVGGYIGAAYFFTSSTSFANPAVTVARSLSDSFAGIAPRSVPTFVGMQLLGLVVAVGAIKVLFPRIGEVAGEVIVPSSLDLGDGHPPASDRHDGDHGGDHDRRGANR